MPYYTIFLLVLLSCFGDMQRVEANVDAIKLAEAQKAADTFVQLTKGSETSSNLPRQSEPEIEQILNRVFNSDALGATAPPVSDAKLLFEFSRNADRVGFAYMLAGTGLTDISKLDSNPAATVIGDRNMVTYAPEIGRWMDFQLDVIKANAASLNAFRASLSPDSLQKPSLKQSFEQVERGVFNGTFSLMQTIATNGETVEWQRDRLRKMIQAVPDITGLLHAESTAKLIELSKKMDAILPDPTVKADLEKLQQMLALH